MSGSLFNKVAGLRPKNIFFTEHVWTTASVAIGEQLQNDSNNNNSVIVSKLMKPLNKMKISYGT